LREESYIMPMALAQDMFSVGLHGRPRRQHARIVVAFP
jgi:hypothetical protein